MSSKPASLTAILDRAAKGFESRFRTEPTGVVSAPGRVNIIGEHTDYHDGYVLPMAISLRTVVALSPRGDGTVAAWSEAFDQPVRFRVEDLSTTRPLPGWGAYVAGVAWALKSQGYEFPGLNLFIASDVPGGSGLSSSAALEVGVGFAFMTAAGVAPRTTDEMKQLAKTCRLAENAYVGVPCGVMDQTTSACAVARSALFIDCRDLRTRQVPIHHDLAVVVCDSGVRHSLAAGQYAVRRQQSETARDLLATRRPEVTALRDARPADLETLTGLLRDSGLDPVQQDIVWRRARHVISEDLRVQQALMVLPEGNRRALASLLEGSHRSLRDDYEVSCPELDTLVETAAKAPGYCGSRMTGGGFGGSTVNLVELEAVDAFREYLKEHVPSLGGVWSFAPDQGVRRES